MGNYTLSGDKFVIDHYDKVPAFSSFLPGLSGVRGIPIWAFYTNRGQGINSFGIHNKGNAIMEFNSANTAYENTPVKGFRTFLRVNGDFYEPFCSYDAKAERRMEIEKNAVSICEEGHGLRIKVEYTILPEEAIGALVRHVEIENISGQEMKIEVLDGMPQIIPYGVHNGEYKEMSNLLKSWADIKNIEHNAPLYTMRASSDDSAEVSEIEGGYFYFVAESGALVPVIYDKNAIFSYDNSMVTPVNFVENGLCGVLKTEQCFANKVPCGFASFEKVLGAGQQLTFTAFSGFASSIELLNQKAAEFCADGYVARKRKEARELVNDYTADVRTKTADPLFDQYMEQCYLDNFLRGGYPFVIGEGENKSVVHLFSRKHGDPERDYNFFSIAGEYYSQGNGNYRDVCQNRRNDVFFHPEIEDFNVWLFYSLTQMDGYNPLEIRPCTFVIGEENQQKASELVKAHVDDEKGYLEKLLKDPFTPGQITNAIAGHQMPVHGDETVLVEELLNLATERIEAGFGEGYWSDHWDYNFDLVENYLLIYPEKKDALLYGNESYRFYDSVGVVRPRRDTYVLNNGKVRQYGSMYHCEEKAAQADFKEGGTNWLKDVSGKEVTTTLFGKMLTLAVNKFALLDPYGMGVEMEGGKPGWNDAMNGLPGLFGSSMPETLELKRLMDFMIKEAAQRPASDTMELPAELAAFMRNLRSALTEDLSDFDYWDKTASYRESFWEEIRLHVSGKRETLTFGELAETLQAFGEKLESAVSKAMELGEGIMPTYFTYEAVSYEEIKNEDGSARISPYGLPSVQVKEFKLVKVPEFLEGPARMLAACGQDDLGRAKAMCAKIKETDIYDQKLKMYKTSGSIEGLSMENGRVRAFTPGWLERESVFLHMEYKYFLGMLKAGLYQEFYEAIGDALIPYQDPEVYGRSILENSSFLASSANPDSSVHGQGFVSRLSGSTVEMLSMWILMFLGETGFYAENGKINLKLSPRLSHTMFDQEGTASFTLCGKCKVTYHNQTGKDTFGAGGAKVARIVLHKDGEEISVNGDTVRGEQAEWIREGQIQAIDAYLEADKEFPWGKSICYSGFRKGQSPREQIYPSREEISEDLHILVDHGFSYIRMYEPNEHAKRVLEVISGESLPLQCMIGIDPKAEVNNPGCPWDKRVRSDQELEENRKKNDAELEELIKLAHQYPKEIIAVSIGNENRPSWGSDLLPVERLVALARHLRESVEQIVTYNEGAGEWLELQALAPELDVISIHSYPAWHQVSVEEAVAYNRKDLNQIRETYPNKQVIFTECGWPSECNGSMDREQVNEEKQEQYIRELTEWTTKEQIPVFLFEAFDEPWKGGHDDHEPEKHWGIWNEDRSPKKAVSLFNK